jgi:F-type H+-transporting ATPase subunit b
MPLFLSFAESLVLVPDGSLVFHILLILVMVFVLNRTLFKPVNSVLATRDRLTHGRTDEAAKIIGEVDENLSKYERTLREARLQSYHTVEGRRSEALGVRDEKLNSVREEIGSLLEMEKRSIDDQANEARAALEVEARRVAATVSSQILGRSVGA